MQDELLRAQQRGFGNRVGFGKRPGLLVVDFSRSFTSPDTALGGEMSAAVDQTNRLIAGARAIGAPIFFSTIAYPSPTRDAGIWAVKISGLLDLPIGSPEVEQDPRLNVRPEDVVFAKRGASCFFGTTLDADLRRAGIDTLVIAGCTTSGCVRASAVDACQYDYRVIVASDATADRLTAAHAQSLIDIDLKYGDVMPVDAILASLAGPAHPIDHRT